MWRRKRRKKKRKKRKKMKNGRGGGRKENWLDISKGSQVNEVIVDVNERKQ